MLTLADFPPPIVRLRAINGIHDNVQKKNFQINIFAPESFSHKFYQFFANDFWL